MIYRRFGTVFSRLLLNKQDEICALEQLLLGMDKTDEREGNDIYLISRAKDVKRDSLPPAWQNKSRGDVMQELEKKALEYGQLQQSGLIWTSHSPGPQSTFGCERSLIHF